MYIRRLFVAALLRLNDLFLLQAIESAERSSMLRLLVSLGSGLGSGDDSCGNFLVGLGGLWGAR